MLLLTIDFFCGDKILKIIDPYIKETEFYDKRIRIWDKNFHHNFKQNVNVKSVGINKVNRFCTNNYGFKSSCDLKKKVTNFEFGFLGDSFVEGIGLNHENTFVGIFEKKTGLSAANLGVSSYSPKIHLAKLNFFLNNGVKFKNIIIFLDISDYYDEAFYQFEREKLIVSHSPKERKRIWLKDKFPFTNYYFYVFKKSRKNFYSKKNITDKNKIVEFDQSIKQKVEWLNKDISKYKINNKTILELHKEIKYYLNQIYKITRKENIKFSLAIYPWPQNLTSKKNNLFYREEWKKFCEKKCTHFFDFFEDLNYQLDEKSYKDVYKNYYIRNDVHFNINGNILIADKILSRLFNKN